MIRPGGFCLLLLFLFSPYISGAPPAQFHGRAQPSNLDSFFERAIRLVQEVMRLLDTAENQEDVVEYCIARLENLLTNCVNLHGIVNGELLQCTAIHFFIAFACCQLGGRESRGLSIQCSR